MSFILNINFDSVKRNIRNKNNSNLEHITYDDCITLATDEPHNSFISNSKNLFIYCLFEDKESNIPILDSIKTLSNFNLNKNLKEIAKSLKGAFFICIYDYKNNSSHCLNDYFGFIPVFFIKTKSSLYISSEISYLLDLHAIKKKPNKERILNFIELSLPSKSATFYKDIFKIIPRNIYILTSKDFKYEPYDSFLVKNRKEFQNSNKNLLKELINVVNSEIDYEKKAGLLFSGGIDSSTIAVAVNYKNRNKLHLYSGNYDDIEKHIKEKIDEQEYKNEIYKKGFKNINELNISKSSTISNLDEFLDIYRQPFFFPNLGLIKEIYEKSKLEGITKIFNGMDGDSVISYGYEVVRHYFFKFNFFKFYYEIRKLAYYSKIKKRSVIKLLLLNPISEYFNSLLKYYKLKRNKPSSSIVNYKFYNHHYKNLKPLNFKKIYDPYQYHNYVLEDPLRYDSIEKQYFLSKKIGITPIYPFYNIDIIKLCVNSDATLKLKKGISRSLIRSSLKNRLPEKNLKRLSKSNLGYGFCYQLSVIDKNFVNSSISEPSPMIKEYINIEKLKEIWNDFQENPYSPESMQNSMSIFIFCVLNEWLKKEFI